MAELSGKYPVVIVIGPRGIGKSMVAKAFYHIYLGTHTGEPSVTAWLRRQTDRVFATLLGGVALFIFILGD